jgi:hypothetical protein
MKNIEYWNNLKFETIGDIPRIPYCEKEEIVNFYAPMLIKAGAIPLNQLKDGVCYLGKCRNSKIARWNGEKNKFVYWRHKFKYVFEEEIEHFENDNGLDFFIPIQIVPNEQYDEQKNPHN